MQSYTNLEEDATLEAPAETLLDNVKRLWSIIFPLKEFVMSSNEPRVIHDGKQEESYRASDMSDGERVGFYLIGHVVTAPKSSVIIIDEPELHLHKVIQNKIFDLLESERDDCVFVYVTHDLDFAVSRRNAVNVWVKGYNGKAWDWEEFDNVDGLPELLSLRVKGSRESVVLVEGDYDSWDYKIYSVVYSDFTVLPSGGGARSVINYTNTLRGMDHMHRLKPVGIIDRDFRTDMDISSLEAKGIYAINTYKVENLLVSRVVIEAFMECASYTKDQASKAMDHIILGVKEKIKENRDRIVANAVASSVREKFRSIGLGHADADSLRHNVASVYNSVDLDKMIEDVSATVDAYIASGDIDNMLKLYSAKKGALYAVASGLGLSVVSYEEQIMRYLSSDHCSGVRDAFISICPVIPG
ncbi:hypothetical protein BSZ36_07595 [Rubricoccus marinus]|uniref:ATPase AAA-type core domain-containing protein n=1 Tax=Rubricoccus marinus TaxID=716817 RepID=A0A259TZ12_9BACT|nr:hypothetical protein BSZ36_07595 [Rubricoccus marinus]